MRRPDALVFFGATGDLAYKKIFPALHAMARRGHLDVPVIGVARVGLDPRAAPGARPREHRASTAASTRRRSRSCAARLRYVGGDYGDPATFAGAAQGARRRAAPAPLPRDPAEPVRDRGRRAGAVGLRRAARASCVEKPFGRDLASARALNATLHAASSTRRDLPHRPLPRQGAGAEPALLPLREHVPRADLEPQLRRERADHDGGELRRRGPRQLLRGGRRDPRRDAEPPAAGRRLPRDGAAGAATAPRRSATRR